MLRRRASFLLGSAVVLALLAFGVIWYVTTQGGRASSPTQTLPWTATTQQTPDGLRITWDRTIKQGTRWLFHFLLDNTSSQELTVISKSKVHQFILTGNNQIPPPNNVGEQPLSTPSASEVQAGYGGVPSTIKPGGIAKGWLAIETAQLSFTPQQLLYRYQVFHTIGCTDPDTPTTCQPADLYGALIWDLSAAPAGSAPASQSVPL